MSTIHGYVRENGTVGIRNHLLIIPSVVCAAHVAEQVSRAVPQSVFIPQQYGCGQVGEDFAQTFRTLAGLGKNPNVGAVLVIGLGCENLTADALAEDIRQTGKPLEWYNIHDQGGTTKSIEHGTQLAKQLQSALRNQIRTEISVDKLVLGLECGGSDATSGMCANPALGVASDLLVREGGSSILTETSEMIGAEHILAKRGVSPDIGEKISRMVLNYERMINGFGCDLRGTQPAPGNIRGGLTTLEEKSLGCILKGGTAEIVDVIQYGEPVRKMGLTLMNSTGDDIDSMIGMAASGAQIIAFTTGGGNPIGTPICPVLKITANRDTAQKMAENIDVYTGEMLEGRTTLEEEGERIFEKILSCCNDEPCAAEILGHREFGIWKLLPTI